MTATVRTSYGALRGAEEDTPCVFRGVPFAKPPVGELRWRPPQPPERWGGARDALEFGPASVQAAGAAQESVTGGAFGAAGLPTDEDCLTLNVWTPGLDGERRPVMVWIHGGVFRVGTGAAPIYDGATLARRGDVVVVTINYRLGVLGLMSLAGLPGEPDSGGANFALLDQIAALEWVRDEIAGFGGDPDNVTVFGESAGAISIGALLGAPRARGLFRRAILESGAAADTATQEDAAASRETLMGALGIARGDAAKLRALTADSILEAQQSLAMPVGRGAGGGFGPVVDGDLLPHQPIEGVREGVASGVAILAGTNRDEWKLFAAMMPGAADVDEGLHARLAMAFPSDDERTSAIDAYRMVRAQRGEDTSPPELLSAILSDSTFRWPATRLTSAQHKHHAQTYMYLFTWPSQGAGGALGSCHALEIPFVFDSFETSLGELAGPGPEAQALSQRMQDAWIAFARTGDPNHDGLPAWPTYEPGRRATMQLDRECEVVDAPMEPERAFWERLR